MDSFKIIEIKEGIFANNSKQADSLRIELKQKNNLLINLMSSPGSGKTTTLVATINKLKSEINIGVMEADIDSDVDAQTIAKTWRQSDPVTHWWNVPSRCRNDDARDTRTRCGRA
ncbi:GTP-binding protein [Moritella viscosa]